MTKHNLHILLALVGDIQLEAHARTKYGLLADALTRQVETVKPCDVSLRWLARYLNALRVFHPNRQIWRERFWKNPLAFEARSRLAAKQVYKHNPDLVLQIGVTFDATRFQSVVPMCIYTDYTAVLSARRPDILRSPFSTPERKLWLSMEKEAYQRATHIFVRSYLVLDSLVKDYDISTEKISITGGGVNFHPLPEIPVHDTNADPQILFIGKEFIRKGGDLLLLAFALVRKELPTARLRIITGEKVPAYLPLAGVEIFPATWDREVIHANYQAADLFVLPSRLETWGDVLLEAMTYGLPCVGMENDAMGEIIRADESGLLVPAGDVSALASALLHLLRDPGLRIRMGAVGRKRVEANFTWDRVAGRMSAVIQERIIS
jgi:glycosyltransferase involved in cell wall biosynthesis